MDEKMYERFKQLCAETGNGNNSTDEEWGELACWLAPEMAEEIIRLRAELTALKERTRWIPIGERLPSIPFYDRYAVLCSGDYLVATFFAGTNEWRYRGQTIYGVSHWMTIPESPEDDK